MRISYSDDEDFPGQFGLFRGNCNRQIASKRGQAVLIELREALLSMPEKRLIANTIAKEGDVCAVGSLLARRRVKTGMSFREAVDAVRALAVREFKYADDEPETYTHEDSTDEVAEREGVPHLVAWSLVSLNDIELDTVWERHEGPVRQGYGSYQGGIAVVRDMTPEERYERVLAWVNARIKPAAGTPERREP